MSGPVRAIHTWMLLTRTSRGPTQTGGKSRERKSLLPSARGDGEARCALEAPVDVVAGLRGLLSFLLRPPVYPLGYKGAWIRSLHQRREGSCKRPQAVLSPLAEASSYLPT